MASPSLSVRAAFFVALACVGSCGSDEPQGSQGAGTQPNVLLLVVDTLRADHLGAYGAARSVPGIDRLAREGVTIEGLRASTSWTMPSMATLFTGQTPAEHRVMRMRGLGAQLLEPRTLAAEFQAAGYATGCIMTNFLMLARRGFDEGFDHYDTSLVNPSHIAVRPPRKSRTWASHGSRVQIKSAKQGRTKEVSALDANSALLRSAHLLRRPSRALIHPPKLRRLGTWWPENADYKANQATSSPADLAQLRALYDEEIHAVGRAIDRVLSELENRGELENTIVVFTADHGEELAERGLHRPHAHACTFEQVNLPFIVRLPSAAQAGQAPPRSDATAVTYVRQPARLGWARTASSQRGQSRAEVAARRKSCLRCRSTSDAFYEVDFVPSRR